MRLPQSISQRLSIRVFSLIAITLLAMITLCAGAAAPQLTCTPYTLLFGSVVIGQSESEVVVLTNSGQTSVTVSAMKTTGTMFKASGLALPLTLPAGQSAPLKVTFSPTSAGWIQAGIAFTSNASIPSLQLVLGGTGATSNSLGSSPASVSFGQVTVGAKSTLPVVLTNTRPWTTKLYAFQMTGYEFSVSGPTLPITLKGGQSVTVNLTFAAQSAGTTGGDLFVTGPNVNVPLSGIGATATAVGQLTVTPASLNFGDVNVGSIGTQAITLSAGGASVTVSSDASSSSQFVLNGATLPFMIPAGQSSSFNVAFKPTASGTASGSLSFTSNASNSTTVESLTGTGTTPQHSISLSWNASTNVAGYNIYRSTSPAGTYARINSTLDANTAYTDSGVAAGQTYYYEATAVNSAGQESGRSTPPVAATIP
jgi:Abnormal spindle-like microcephaly-assoc'd, ASPM-SPD-2-Hydin